VRGSIIDGLYEMDPWNRKFPIFPYEKLTSGEYGYRGYYSDIVNEVYYNDEAKTDRNNIKHNVMILITSVNRQSVYCVDILAGKYGSW
jgi:hypothetical protein